MSNINFTKRASTYTGTGALQLEVLGSLPVGGIRDVFNKVTGKLPVFANSPVLKKVVAKVPTPLVKQAANFVAANVPVVQKVRQAVQPAPVAPLPQRQDCPECRPVPVGPDMTPVTRAELFQFYVAVDYHLIEEAVASGMPLAGLGTTEVHELRAALAEVISMQVTDAEVMALAAGQSLSGLGGLKDVWNKIKNSKVVTAVKNVVKKAAEVVHKVVALPARGLVSAAIAIFAGKASAAFAYALIPDNHEAITRNPEVKRKRDRQLNFINLLTKGAAFQPGYVLKHLRNGMRKAHGVAPEEFIKMVARRQQLTGLGEVSYKCGVNGLGEVVTFAAMAAATVAAITPILPFVPDIIKAFKPKEDAPEGGDFVAPDAAENLSPAGEGGGDNGGGNDDDPTTQSALEKYLPWMIGVPTAAALIYYLAQPKKGRKR